MPTEEMEMPGEDGFSGRGQLVLHSESLNQIVERILDEQAEKNG